MRSLPLRLHEKAAVCHEEPAFMKSVTRKQLKRPLPQLRSRQPKSSPPRTTAKDWIARFISVLALTVSTLALSVGRRSGPDMSRDYSSSNNPV